MRDKLDILRWVRDHPGQYQGQLLDQFPKRAGTIRTALRELLVACLVNRRTESAMTDAGIRTGCVFWTISDQGRETLDEHGL